MDVVLLGGQAAGAWLPFLAAQDEVRRQQVEGHGENRRTRLVANATAGEHSTYLLQQMYVDARVCIKAYFI